MKIENQSKTYQSVPAGTHGAYLIGIYDIGTQNGLIKYPDPKRQLKLQFEIPFEKITIDGIEKPMNVWATYTAFTGERANFRPVFEALYKGTPTEEDYTNIDFNKLIGSPCNVTVVQNGNYMNVSQVTPLTKGLQLPPIEGELKMLDLDNFDQKTFDTLGEKLKEKIKLSPEYEKATESKFDAPTQETNQELPFN